MEQGCLWIKKYERIATGKIDWINTIGAYNTIQYTYSEFEKPIIGDSSKDNMDE